MAENKYHREKGDKPESKYIRDKGAEEVKSRYVKTDEDKDAKPLSGSARYEEYLERDRQREEAAEEAERLAAQKAELEAQEEKAAEAEAFVTDTEADETAETSEGEEEPKSKDKKRYNTSDIDTKKKENQNMIRRVLCCAGLGAAALFLQFMTVHVPFTPKVFKLDFSTFPELIAAIAYGPLAGIAITFAKNLIYAIVSRGAAATALSNVVLDSIFVLISSLFYSRNMFAKRGASRRSGQRKDPRRKTILASGLVAGLTTSGLSYFMLKFVTFPYFFAKYADYYDEASMVAGYQSAWDGLRGFLPDAISKYMPDLNTLSDGILFYNVPINFAKLFGSAVIVAIIYKWISPFLHNRHKSKKK